MKKSEIQKLVGGRFFSVEFIKRDGSIRKINGRLGVHKHVKGTGHAKQPSELVTVWSVGDKAYRSFYPDKILKIKASGKTLVL